MPNAKTQRYMAWIGVVGTLTACFGCSLIISNQPSQLNAARAFLVLSWLILVPLFFYVLIIRNRAAAEQKRRLRKQATQKQKELEALATVEGILTAGAEPPEPNGPSPTDTYTNR